MNTQIIGLDLLKKNAQAISRLTQTIKDRDAQIARLKSQVATLKSWVEGSHMGTVIERSDGNLQLLSPRE